jgi:spore coat polysaccharide biosynthesis protein SpsF
LVDDFGQSRVMSDRGQVSLADRPVICISQARMGSTRLPGKVMLPILGRPMLSWHLSRLGRSKQIDRLVVATTVDPRDDAIVELCQALGVAFFRGSESDVLRRYAGAAAAFGAATVVRVTSDCPLIDPQLVDEVIAHYGSRRPKIDYVTLEPEDFPRGLDTEVFSHRALIEAHRDAVDPPEREHVTPHIYRHPEQFRCAKLKGAERLGQHRWCVDEKADYELIRRMIEGLAPTTPNFGWRDCLALLAAHPDWLALNRTVIQKTLRKDADTPP